MLLHESVIRGHHIYKSVWNPRLGEIDCRSRTWHALLITLAKKHALIRRVRLLTRLRYQHSCITNCDYYACAHSAIRMKFYAPV